MCFVRHRLYTHILSRHTRAKDVFIKTVSNRYNPFLVAEQVTLLPTCQRLHWHIVQFSKVASLLVSLCTRSAPPRWTRFAFCATPASFCTSSRRPCGCLASLSSSLTCPRTLSPRAQVPFARRPSLRLLASPPPSPGSSWALWLGTRVLVSGHLDSSPLFLLPFLVFLLLLPLPIPSSSSSSSSSCSSAATFLLPTLSSMFFFFSLFWLLSTVSFEIKVLSAENRKLSKVFSLKLSVGQNSFARFA